MYKDKIREGLKNNRVVYNGTNVEFEDGSIIGGVLVQEEEELVEVINNCFSREDFIIPKFLTE